MTETKVVTPAPSHAGAARTLAVLEAVAQNAPEPSTVTGLAESLGLSKTVVHRLLQELVGAGFLAYEAELRRYRLGPQSLMVGMAALRSLDVPEVARPFLERLVKETGETATLSVRQGWSRVYVDQVASPREIKMTVALGTAHPLHAGSSSKAILAWLEPDEIASYLDRAQLRALTDGTITTPEALTAELEQVRGAGFAMSLGERQEGAASVAAPVFVSGGTPWGSISVCGPRDRFSASDHQRYAALVRTAAHEVSVACGYAPTERKDKQ